MKASFIFIFLFTTKLFGQALTEPEIVKYVRSIDSLKKKHQLQEYFYPNMSGCGGGLYGWYAADKLVYIDATYAGELGYTSTKMYLRDTTVYKIIYREYVPEWDKFIKHYPEATEKEMKKHMTYLDRTYTIIAAQPMIITTRSNRKAINDSIDSGLPGRLFSCGQEMRKELESEKVKP
jgi:hypothetical protein